MSENRERAEKIFSDVFFKGHPFPEGDSLLKGLDDLANEITAALDARDEGLVAAAVRKGYKAGWESAMYQAHVEYGADEDAPVRKLSDRDIAALVEGAEYKEAGDGK